MQQTRGCAGRGLTYDVGSMLVWRGESTAPSSCHAMQLRSAVVVLAGANVLLMVLASTGQVGQACGGRGVGVIPPALRRVAPC
jgi:hypothetical protein